jgi:hypothetical protein
MYVCVCACAGSIAIYLANGVPVSAQCIAILWEAAIFDEVAARKNDHKTVIMSTYKRKTFHRTNAG